MIRCALLLILSITTTAFGAVTVGSKSFNESVILGEIAAQSIRANRIEASHRRQLGGTRVLFDALLRGDIDVYPEYTGTIEQEILNGQPLASFASRGISMTRPLGFNNTYAIGVRTDLAQRLGLKTISDLRKYPELTFGFTNEFMDRKDGWPALRGAYHLPQANVTGLDHDLAYRALASGSIDVTDLYSTDAEIAYYKLVILDDDLHHFPRYDAVYLFRSDLNPIAVAAIKRLEGTISQAQMIQMNAQAKLQRVPEAQVASNFLATLGIRTIPLRETNAQQILQRTREHLFLVGVSLLAAIFAGIPLGIIAYVLPRIGQLILIVIAAIYTIPSLALLVFMIPLLGIGAWPAIVALFLYSLLPIVRNTHEGLREIPASLRESARALGLTPIAQLSQIELPLALGPILAGIKTSAVINVGTATLGALIGAGGYGQPILTGIRLDNVALILQGAVPAALMALAAQGLFDLLERLVMPRGLRLQPEHL